MFGLSIVEIIIILAVLIGIVVVVGKRNPGVNAKLLDLLPDAGDRALLALQAQIPDDAELREKTRAALDAAEAKAESVARAYLTKRGYTVTKPGEPI